MMMKEACIHLIFTWNSYKKCKEGRRRMINVNDFRHVKLLNYFTENKEIKLSVEMSFFCSNWAKLFHSFLLLLLNRLSRLFTFMFCKNFLISFFPFISFYVGFSLLIEFFLRKWLILKDLEKEMTMLVFLSKLLWKCAKNHRLNYCF